MIVDYKSDHDNTTDKSTYTEYVHTNYLLCKLIYTIKAYARGKVYKLNHPQFTAAAIKYSLWFPERFLLGITTSMKYCIIFLQ